MAKWRAIHATITTDGKVNRLSEFGQLLYDRIVVKADDWGIITGDTFELKGETIPLSSRNFEELDDPLQEMLGQSLIWRYEVDSFGPLIQIRKFDEHQPGALISKRTAPKLPLHPDWRPIAGDNRSADLLEEVASLIPGISDILQELIVNGSPRTDKRRTEQTREEENRTDKSKSRESDAAVPDLSIDIFTRLECLGIAMPVVRELAALEHVTPEYLEGWRLWLHSGGGEKLDNPAGYLVKRIREADDPP